MSDLTPSERELVALGAAMGSNCVPCIEYHIPAARNAGLTDSQIADAIQLADKVRQVPARKVLNAARGMLSATPAAAQTADSHTGCAQAESANGADGSCCT